MTLVLLVKLREGSYTDRVQMFQEAAGPELRKKAEVLAKRFNVELTYMG